ncbi:hypothetical protein [Vibrio echinoideorum]|uniref:hypothetical protein n=1 Tax=Vibrio echinoideorum TaxID=2100116 RepID=UPI0010805780|nr:hypothetical protein [Vibrio echinoideorum]
MTSKYFDPQKSFLHLQVVWGAISALLTFAIVIALVIIFNTSLVWDLSANGFNYFIFVFRFPLGILAMIIPIVALLAANHRSEQTKEQIKATGLQNNFSNYYKHLEEFVKYSQENLKDIQDLDFRLIHKRIYPNSQEGDYEICRELFQALESSSTLISGISENYPKDFNEGIPQSDYEKYIGLVNKLGSYLGNNSGRFTAITSDPFDTYAKTYLKQSLLFLERIIYLCTLIERMCHFTVDFKSKSQPLIGFNFNVNEFNVIESGDDDELDPFDYQAPRDFDEVNQVFIEKLKENKVA